MPRPYRVNYKFSVVLYDWVLSEEWSLDARFQDREARFKVQEWLMAGGWVWWGAIFALNKRKYEEQFKQVKHACDIAVVYSAEDLEALRVHREVFGAMWELA